MEGGEIEETRILDEGFSSFKMHASHLGILLNAASDSVGLGWGPRSLPF